MIPPIVRPKSDPIASLIKRAQHVRCNTSELFAVLFIEINASYKNVVKYDNLKYLDEHIGLVGSYVYHMYV
jgi:hypothetical protein